MMEDLRDFIFILFAIVVLGFSVIGLAMVTADYRHFLNIQEQCESTGYIQNDITRITCSVEKVN